MPDFLIPLSGKKIGIKCPNLKNKGITDKIVEEKGCY